MFMYNVANMYNVWCRQLNQLEMKMKSQNTIAYWDSKPKISTKEVVQNKQTKIVSLKEVSQKHFKFPHSTSYHFQYHLIS